MRVCNYSFNTNPLPPPSSPFVFLWPFVSALLLQQAAQMAINDIAQLDADDHYVFLISDANLRRYEAQRNLCRCVSFRMCPPSCIS